MKTSKIAILAALGVLAVLGQAEAACPNGQQAYYTATSATPPVVTEHCVKVSDKGATDGWITDGDGVAWTGNLNKHLTPVLVDHDSNSATPPIPLVIDGKPIVTTDGNATNGEHQHTVPVVNGINGIAIGDGAKVGREVPQVGTAASCSSGSVNSAGTGCNTSTAVFTPASADFVAKHTVYVDNGTALGAGASVQHNNSTAVGAGAKSTDTNQVTLGTKDETIRAEGITSQKSKDRQVGPREVVTSDSGGRLATDGGEIFNRLGSLETVNVDQGSAINAHSALLSEHSATLADHGKRLDSVEKGLAIATAMPDTWLSDKQSFAIAAGVGGFGDEVALGFAAIGRIDETWSVNAGFGGDTEFKEFGWKAGVRAGW